MSYICGMVKIGIYKITSPSKRVYIGQSVNIERRFRQYKNMSNCNDQSTLFRSLLKHGFENHVFEVLELCSCEILTERESFWIDFFNSTNKKKGMNIRNAGSKGKLSNDTKIKISKANKGKKRTEEQKNKLSKYKKENPTKFWTGKKRDKKTIEKIRLSLKGVVNANKPIIHYDLQMNEIGRYESATDASRKLNIGRSSIKNNLLGLSKTCKKSIFKYAL